MGQGLLGNLQIPSQPSPDIETRTCTPLPLLAVPGIATWTLATTGGGVEGLAEEGGLSQMPRTTWFGQDHPLPFATRATICKNTHCLSGTGQGVSS